MIEDNYEKWYKDHGCDHAHCPDGCEHPQPVLLSDGRMVCGRCRHKYGETVEVLPCGPEICKEHQ